MYPDTPTTAQAEPVPIQTHGLLFSADTGRPGTTGETVMAN